LNGQKGVFNFTTAHPQGRAAFPSAHAAYAVGGFTVLLFHEIIR